MIAHLRGRLLAKHPNQVILEVSGVGYAPDGEVVPAEGPGADARAGLEELLRAALLCNDARILPPDPGGNGEA